MFTLSHISEGGGGELALSHRDWHSCRLQLNLAVEPGNSINWIADTSKIEMAVA